MTDLAQIAQMIEQQGDALEEFKTAQNNRLKTLESNVTDILKKAGRPGAPGIITAPATPSDSFINVKTKERVPVLEHKDSLFALEEKTEAKAAPSIGRVLRGIVSGAAADDAKELAEERKALAIEADPSGGYTVGGVLSSSWIDLLRANMVLSKAGALTVPMSSKELALAKVTGSPDVYWHKENASITPSDPTFGAVKLDAKTVVTVVKMSVELAQDSANIEQILQRTLTQAVAHAIDEAGLVGVSTNAAAAPSGIFNLSGRNSVTSIGAPTSWDFLIDGMYELLADNVPEDQIGAMIAHPSVWKKMAKLKTGITSDNTPLAMPAAVANVPKLWTTAAPLTGGTTAKGIIANWSDLLFGVRKDIQVRVLQEAFFGSNLQFAIVVYARVDFAATRAESFCTLEGITV